MYLYSPMTLSGLKQTLKVRGLRGQSLAALELGYRGITLII